MPAPTTSDDVQWGIRRSGWGSIEVCRTRDESPPRNAPCGPTPGEALRDSLGRPGLWKEIADPVTPATTRRVFEVPPPLMNEAEARADLLDWARTTEPGDRDRTWAPPPRAELEARLSSDAWTLELRAGTRSLRLRHGPGELALDVAAVTGVPPDLSPSRRRWLQALLWDARRRWRLVRVGVDVDAAVRVEVDLSGAPTSVLATLVPIAAEALRLVTDQIVEPVELLVDDTRECRSLELCSHRAGPGKGDLS